MKLLRKLPEYSFREVKTDTIYPLKGSYPDFELKDYCPAVFRNIIELQNIDYTDYLRSICGDEHLLHFVASGKFGDVFVSPVHDKFVMKILRKSELKVMLEMLPSYYHHLETYRASLLSKLFGLHTVRLFGGVKAHIAVLSNELKSSLKVHTCYDLKGTTVGRKPSSLVAENCRVLKDVDFDFCFYLDPIVHPRLLKQIKYDCEFLEAEGIMDYSLLLGIHIEGQGSHRDSPSEGSSSSGSSYPSKMGNLDFSEGSNGEELCLSNLYSPSESKLEKFGKDMPGRAVQIKKNENGSIIIPRGTNEAEEYLDVVLNFAIVDIFQNYSVSKRIEHLYKSLQYDRHLITAVKPKEYSSRFQDFLGKVFQQKTL